MNNTTRTLAIAAILAVTLVVGGMLATTTHSAYAYKKDHGKGNGNGNTVTIQECKQLATESGFDNTQEQECENLICTHPGENATCVQEGAAAVTPIPTPVKLTCEQCFTSLLTADQIRSLQGGILGPDLCAFLPQLEGGEIRFRFALEDSGVTSVTIQNELIACLLKAGIVFRTT